MSTETPTPTIGAPYMTGPTFPVERARGRRVVVRAIEPITVNVLGQRHTAPMVTVAFVVRGRVVEDCLHLDEWRDAWRVG